MASAGELMGQINLMYRNSYTDAQKIVWMNEEQRELFDILEIDSPPYGFETILDNNFYPLPIDFDVTKIKVVTMQIVDSSTNPIFQEVPMKRNDDNVSTDYQPWYTIVSDAFFLYYPGGVPDVLPVYIYLDADPTDITEASLSITPDLPIKYQEILKLGVLKRMAMARKDATMANNYDASYQEKISDVLWNRKLKEPEFVQPANPKPFLSHSNGYIVNGW